DAGAVATDKEALLPGRVGTFGNVTSYARGINGIIVEMRNLAPSTDLGAGDFEFQVSGDDDPDEWAGAPQPLEMVTRRSAVPEEPAAVYITWADGAIRNQWLRVTVKAT